MPEATGVGIVHETIRAGRMRGTPPPRFACIALVALALHFTSALADASRTEGRSLAAIPAATRAAPGAANAPTGDGATAADAAADADADAAADYSAILDALWDYDAPAASEVRFRAERARHAAGSREALEAGTQVGRTLGLQRRFTDADAVLAAIEPALRDVPVRVRVRWLLERGRVRNSSGQPAAAVPLFLEALRASERDRLPGAAFYQVDALHMLGIAAPGDAALEWNREALAAAARAPDARTRGWQASLLHNLGWTLHQRGEYAQALAYWQQALALREAAGKPEPLRIARWTVARGLRSLGRLDEAEAIQRDLAGEMEQANAPDGYVYEELTEIALARGRDAQARAAAARAYRLLKDDADLVAREPARLQRLARIGGITP